MTTLDLAVLRTIAEAATPGPWYTPYGAEGQVWYGASEAEVRRVCVGLDHGTVTEAEGEEVFEQTHSLAYGDIEHQRDADFIATFDPTTVLALLDRLEQHEGKPCGQVAALAVGRLSGPCVVRGRHTDHRADNGDTWIESVR